MKMLKNAKDKFFYLVNNNKVFGTIYFTIVYAIILILLFLLVKYLLVTLIISPIVSWWGSLGWGGKILAIWIFGGMTIGAIKMII